MSRMAKEIKMKKGFTLIELLIVMVIVGVLVAVALPKYQTALERGRALEGISNVRAISDYLNAQYILHGNQYLTNDDIKQNATKDLVKSKYFEISIQGSTVIAKRKDGWYYAIEGFNTNGELATLRCIKSEGNAPDTVCEDAGMVLNENILLEK